MRRLARAASIVLSALGAGLLAVGAAHIATGVSAQASARRDLLDGFRPSVSALPARNLPRARPHTDGDPLGRLEIPRVGLDAVVFEGVSAGTLRKGPGHLSETAWPTDSPDTPGNCVIAGHRDSFFRSLRDAREGDMVRLADGSGVRLYRLERRRIVGPGELSVVAPTSEDRLTLITCYPFRWIGAAPLRLVWSATATSSPRTEDSSSGGALPRIPEESAQLH